MIQLKTIKNMKKIFYAILGAALLFSACEEEGVSEIEQIPYRKVMEYTPSSYTMEVPGKLTPDADYDWITLSQTDGKAVFTVIRNTKDIVRRAEYSIAGSKHKVVISQKAHTLDASLEASLSARREGEADFSVTYKTNFPDDYVDWGIIWGTSSNIDECTKYSKQGLPAIGANTVTLKDVEDDTDYFFWAYVTSTEGDRIVSNLAAIASVYVRAGEDLQAAIDGAIEYSTIKVQGGCTFPGGIVMGDNNKNKTISGGWNADFTEQSMDNLTVIDGQGINRGILCAANANDEPLKGFVNISYFEIKNCKADHGSAIHICGGPLTVTNCYVHDNVGEKGAIATREEDFSSILTVANCILTANNAPTGHGAVFGLGDGVSNEDQVMATIVNNLIVKNSSTAFGGYSSVCIIYNETDLVFVNNTVVGNMNYCDGPDEYSGIMMRDRVRCLFANNIMVGNRISDDKLDPPVWRPFVGGFFDMDNTIGTAINNIIEGEILRSQDATLKGNKILANGADYSDIITSDYKPTGASLGFGTLDKVNYKGRGDASPKTCDIKALLEKYGTDVAGNPRIVNGKVDAGCYQAQ